MDDHYYRYAPVVRTFFVSSFIIWMLSIACGLVTNPANTLECVSLAFTTWFVGILLLRYSFTIFMSKKLKEQLRNPARLRYYLAEETPITKIFIVVTALIYFCFMGRMPAIACCVFLGILFTNPLYRILMHG